MNEQEMKNFILIKRVVIALIAISLFFIGAGSGVFMSLKYRNIIPVAQRINAQEDIYVGEVNGLFEDAEKEVLGVDVDFDLFWEVWNTLKNDYVNSDELNDKKMFYGALRGLVASVGDPYTVFMDPKISQDFADDMAGTFEGIGAEIGIKGDILTIIAPLPDMPAEIAGLKAGDKVLAINGTTTMGITIDAAVNKIRGTKGTDVTLSIKRGGEDLQDIVITRGAIVVKSVRTEMRDDGIYKIRVTNYNNDTRDSFNKAVRFAVENNPKGIILDLRNNPGGYLDTAIEMASEWVEDGLVVVEKYSEELKNEHLARGRARLKNIPTVVLVNQGSASASEIVAGALQDHGKAKIVGKQTFGKGSVQTLNNLKDGSSIKITVAKWLTPSGRSINDEGIEPDIDIDLKIDDYNEDIDPQIEKAVEILTGDNLE
jgi:carboxyl-terminal processing protease